MACQQPRTVGLELRSRVIAAMEIDQVGKRWILVRSGSIGAFSQLCFLACVAITAILLKFRAIATSDHSPCTKSRQRNRNCRKRITDLMMPNTGSTVYLLPTAQTIKLASVNGLVFAPDPAHPTGKLSESALPVQMMSFAPAASNGSTFAAAQSSRFAAPTASSARRCATPAPTAIRSL